MSIPPETRYARNGAIHLAYQVLGSGPPDLLVVGPGLNAHVDYAWMEPSLARYMRRPGGIVPYGYPLFHTHGRPQLYSG